MKEFKNVKNILVRVPNWIGDAVMSMPALDALRRLYPKARITVLCKPIVKDIYSSSPSTDEVLVYDSRGVHAGFFGKLRLARELKKNSFDMAVLFQNAFEAAWISYLAGIPIRIGYARDLRRALLTSAISFVGEITRVHQVYYYLNIIKALGGPELNYDKKPLPNIKPTESDMARAREILEEVGMSDVTSFVGVAPGASFGPAKKWGSARFAEAAEKVCEELKATALIFGGPSDARDAKEVAEGLKVRHLNLASRTTLGEFIALTSMTKIFLTNDSGTMHVAAALGVPTVAVFGSTEPRLTSPLGNVTRTIQSNLDCSPCFKRECLHGHYECMSAVTVDDVVASAMKLLEGGQDG
ncbi:MAG: lipopolysaccharide heptosyltransferase II [Deltaproteobacteria bacterium]|nr:lipopolysaccharide heptosyltransferase II [Deltaproteobacteria bacterium]